MNYLNKKRFLLDDYFYYQFLNNFSELMCKINFFDIVKMTIFFLIFVVLCSTKILSDSNFWSYVRFFDFIKHRQSSHEYEISACFYPKFLSQLLFAK